MLEWFRSYISDRIYDIYNTVKLNLLLLIMREVFKIDPETEGRVREGNLPH